LLKSKLKGILTMMIIKTKALEIGKIHLKHIWTYLFQMCFLKSYSFLCYLKCGCIIYIYIYIYSKNLLHSKHNYKSGMKNVENRKIDQDRNAMC
jgi:hypothetical protein